MSIARHHNEWLSLLDVSGPFLSIPVLLRTLPQGLGAHEPEVARTLRAAFDEWEAAVPLAKAPRAPDPAIHTAWLDHVFREVLGYPATHWLTGSTLPPGLEAVLPDHGETLRATHALKAPGDALPRLLVQTWPAHQALDKPVPGARWHVASPHTRLMTLLHATGVPLGLATNGAQWSLVAARTGQATTFVTWHAHLWAEEPLTLRALQTLLSARRFFASEPGNDLASLIAASLSDQQEVTDQLGLQVRSAVEVLVRSLDRINAGMSGRLLREVTPGQLYEAALAVMMRLVFLLCAEERRLLPADDALYAQYYAIDTLRDQLREAADRGSEQVLESRHDAWARLLATFRLVHGGCEHGSLRLPAYGGSLFDPDRHAFLEGRPVGTRWRQVAAQPLPISNRTVLHLLEALQFLQMRVHGGSTEARRLSFRALDIEQIGHVYEGLLDHTAQRADEPVLGLGGVKGKDFEVGLATLEAKRSEGIPALVEFLKGKTGRGAAALRRATESPPTPGPEQQRALHRACGTDAALLARGAALGCTAARRQRRPSPGRASGLGVGHARQRPPQHRHALHAAHAHRACRRHDAGAARVCRRRSRRRTGGGASTVARAVACLEAVRPRVRQRRFPRSGLPLPGRPAGRSMGTRRRTPPGRQPAADDPGSHPRRGPLERAGDAHGHRGAPRTGAAAGRRALPLRRRREPHGGGDGQAVAVADHAAQGPALHLSRPRRQVRRQPARGCTTRRRSNASTYAPSGPRCRSA